MSLVFEQPHTIHWIKIVEAVQVLVFQSNSRTLLYCTLLAM